MFHVQERVEDGTFVYFPHRVGRSILVCGRRSAQFPYHILVSYAIIEVTLPV